jgi:hypothetical protein
MAEKIASKKGTNNTPKRAHTVQNHKSTVKITKLFRLWLSPYSNNDANQQETGAPKLAKLYPQ